MVDIDKHKCQKNKRKIPVKLNKNAQNASYPIGKPPTSLDEKVSLGSILIHLKEKKMVSVVGKERSVRATLFVG